jgi:hypothetical protein
LKFGIVVGIGERMSGKEFGENWKFKMAARGSFSIKKFKKFLLKTTVATK